jgi:hypothetical protein
MFRRVRFVTEVVDENFDVLSKADLSNQKTKKNGKFAQGNIYFDFDGLAISEAIARGNPLLLAI